MEPQPQDTPPDVRNQPETQPDTAVDATPERLGNEWGEENAAGSQPQVAEIGQAAQETRATRTQAVIRKEAYKSVAKIISSVDKDNPAHEETIAAAASQLVENTPNLSEAEARARVEQAESFLDDLDISVADGVELAQSERELIGQLLCEPILRGHLSGETAGMLVSGVQVMSGAAIKKYSMDNFGYEGVMLSDSEHGKIIISKEVLTGEYAPEGKTLDIRHMLSHEMSHTAVEDAFYPRDPDDPDKRVKNSQANSFAREVIAMAQTAKADRIPQPRHVDAVLDMLAGLRAEYDAREGADPNGFDQFRQERETSAAREILTDYTAIFLQSDGTQKGFINEMLSKVSGDRINEYFSSSSEAGDSSDQQLVDILRTPPEERAAKLEQFPRYCKVFESYNRFYELAKANISDAKIKEGALLRIEHAGDDESITESLESVVSQGSGDGSGKGEKDKADAHSSLISGFANEVDIITPGK